MHVVGRVGRLLREKCFSSPTQLLMSREVLALVSVCSNRKHILSLMAVGKSWAAEPPAALNSLSHKYMPEAFNASSG